MNLQWLDAASAAAVALALRRLRVDRVRLLATVRDAPDAIVPFEFERVFAEGGNPFFALELGRELQRHGIQLEPQAPLPLPSSFGALLGGRLGRLPEPTREVLLVVALAGRPTANLVASAYGDREEALAALEVAAREGVVATSPSSPR